MLTIRVSDDVKELIEKAAGESGQTMSAFLLEAATKAAARIQRKRGSGSVAESFGRICRSALSGGEFGYEQVGGWFPRRMERLAPSGGLPSAWRVALAELSQIVMDNDRDKVARWFEKYLPNYIQAVPSRRRPNFAAGFLSEAQRAFYPRKIGAVTMIAAWNPHGKNDSWKWLTGDSEGLPTTKLWREDREGRWTLTLN